MLRPYVCVACEKVIIAADMNASLISLFNKITIVVPAEAEIPKNAVVPKEWSVFSAWDTEPGDELKGYTICMQLLYPDQTPFMEVTKIKPVVELNKRSQVDIRMMGFPIGQVGQYSVLTWVEEGQQKVFGPIEFKVELEIARQEKTPKAI